MRIGELVDLPVDALHPIEGERWAVRVLIGKLHSERWPPADVETCDVVARILALRPPPADRDSFLLPRWVGREQLLVHPRQAPRAAAQSAGCSRSFVPHQLRHTCGTAWIRSGMSLPAVMKLMGHTTPAMTMFYVQVTQADLQREYLLAVQRSPHTLRLPADGPVGSVLDALRRSVRLLDAARSRSRSRRLDSFRRRLVGSSTRPKSFWPEKWLKLAG